MFGRQLKLFTLVGFDIKVDVSWLFLAVLVTWSLATGYFPTLYSTFDERTLWIMGASGAMGLFVSIVLHELGHSIVARSFGMKIKGITLFIFGGVAELEDEPPSALAEFLVAIAGPLVSLAIALTSFRAVAIANPGTDPVTSPVLAVVGYIGVVNMLLAVFNMLPAFPLDGGRAFRAILWGLRGSMKQATVTAARVGSFFGFLFIVFGIFFLLSGNTVGGLWWALIGLFLRGAASSAISTEVTRKAMEGEVVATFMVRDPVSVPPDLTLDRFVDDYLYHFFHDVYPVVDGDGMALGLLHTKAIKDHGDRLSEMTVRQVMEPLSTENMIAPGVDAMRAVNQMNRTGKARLLVVEYGKLLGIVTLRDMLRLLELKMDLDPRH